jgi:hypothetical protein
MKEKKNVFREWVNNNNKVTMNHCTHLSFKAMSKIEQSRIHMTFAICIYMVVCHYGL